MAHGQKKNIIYIKRYLYTFSWLDIEKQQFSCMKQKESHKNLIMNESAPL